MRVKRACAVDKQSPRAQAFPCLCHYLALQHPAFLNVLLAPLLYRLRVFAKHTLTRTGNIAEDDIKLHLALAYLLGIIADDRHTGRTPLTHILHQYRGTSANGFVAQQPTALGDRGDGCQGLASRSGTHIKHLHRRGHILTERTLNEHRRCLLHIIATGMQQRVESEIRTAGQIITISRPGHSLALLHLDITLSPVDTNAHRRLFGKSFDKGSKELLTHRLTGGNDK